MPFSEGSGHTILMGGLPVWNTLQAESKSRGFVIKDICLPAAPIAGPRAAGEDGSTNDLSVMSWLRGRLRRFPQPPSRAARQPVPAVGLLVVVELAKACQVLQTGWAALRHRSDVVDL